MEWFYGLNGAQNGPVSEAGLDELLRSGTINGETLVWRTGMANWQPLRIARATGTSAPPPIIGGAPGGVCVECGRPFPQSEMVFLNQSWVCAECKPIFLQRWREGGAPRFDPNSVWRFGKQIVLRTETHMPDRCVRCNAPANGFQLKRRLYWHSPVFYALILINLLIYIIVAIIIRKRAVVYVGLCDTHRRQRKWFIAASWLGTLGGIFLLIVGIADGSGILGLSGAALFIAGLVAYFMRIPVVTAAKIEKDMVWLKGGGTAFLAELPEWLG